MLFSEIIAVCSQIHTKHINTLCGQNVEFVNVKLVVHIVTTWQQRFKEACNTLSCIQTESDIYENLIVADRIESRF
jgi:hypothetical protein